MKLLTLPIIISLVLNPIIRDGNLDREIENRQAKKEEYSISNLARDLNKKTKAIRDEEIREENKKEETKRENIRKLQVNLKGTSKAERKVEKKDTKPLKQLYSLSDLKFQGIIRWSGYKFTYYSQKVLPGKGLRIPGRHINKDGFIADKDGYIVLSNSAPNGTIIKTPFGYYGKVYDKGVYGNHFDAYTR